MGVWNWFGKNSGEMRLRAKASAPLEDAMKSNKKARFLPRSSKALRPFSNLVREDPPAPNAAWIRTPPV
jgi:hypothetical protein